LQTTDHVKTKAKEDGSTAPVMLVVGCTFNCWDLATLQEIVVEAEAKFLVPLFVALLPNM
jgi:hypothetical protein